MRIAVCDDEPLAIDDIVNKIQAYVNMKHAKCNVSKFSDGESLLEEICKKGDRFDAIYLDIKMKLINGIDTAKAIRKVDSKAIIVFVTALKEYVFDAFDVNATNFLLKPVDEEKLFTTLDKISTQANALIGQSLVISSNGKVEKIPFSSIVYCEVLNHRLFIYEKDCMYEYAGKIENLEEKLPSDFFRCHRSYIVNYKFIENYKDGFVYLSSDEKIPVATRRRQAFMQGLLHYQRNEVR